MHSAPRASIFIVTTKLTPHAAPEEPEAPIATAAPASAPGGRRSIAAFIIPLAFLAGGLLIAGAIVYLKYYPFGGTRQAATEPSEDCGIVKDIERDPYDIGDAGKTMVTYVDADSHSSGTQFKVIKTSCVVFFRSDPGKETISFDADIENLTGKPLKVRLVFSFYDKDYTRLCEGDTTVEVPAHSKSAASGELKAEPGTHAKAQKWEVVAASMMK